MSIRLEQLNVSSVAKVFVTRIEMGNEIFKNVSDYMKNRVEVGEGLELSHSTGSDGNSIDIFTLNTASHDTLGGVKIGRNITLDSQDRINVDLDQYTSGEGIEIVNSDDNEKIKIVNLNKATTDAIGGIIAGAGLSINEEGVLSVNTNDMTLGNESEVGLVKPGTGLETDGEGTISVKIGEGIQLDEQGRLMVVLPEVNTASKTQKGIVKIGNGINVTQDGTISVTEYNLESYAGENITFKNNKFNVNKTNVGTGLTLVKESEFVSRIDSKVASKSQSGIVKIGEGINVTEDGIISNPIATNSSKGMVQIGTNLTIEEGILNADVGINEINALKEEIKTLKLRYDAIASEVENLSSIIGNLGSSNIQGKYGTSFMSGSLVFNAITGSNVEFPKALSNADYKVAVITSIPTNGSQGELWIENKTTKGFTIRTSGSMATSKCDWVVFLDESDSTEFNQNTFPYQKGKTSLNSRDGVQVTLDNAMKDTNYGVFITALNSPLGTYGEVWVENKTTTGFTIKSSGGTTGEVEFLVAAYGKDNFNVDTCPIQVGHDTFNGNIPKVISLDRPLSSKDYQVMIGLEGNPNGCLGDYFVFDKGADYFSVNTTGSTDIKFNYLVIGK